MRKYKIFLINIKKEEDWISEIIRQGYQLVSVGNCLGFYDFEPCTTGSVPPMVRIDYRIFKKKAEYEDYVAIFEDSGWKHIGGTKSSGKQYFEKVSAEIGTERDAEVGTEEETSATEDIFSDHLSKAERNKRISTMWFSLFCAYLPILVVFSMNGIFRFSTLLHPKSLYLTSGLWEKTGSDFARAFLFETPFAMGRGFSGLIILLLILGYAYFGLKSLYWYHREKSMK
ncbi:MAG: DUF2812 domain-containing protein [Mobilitalea sp.]